MKKFTMLTAALVMSVCFAVAAQANVLADYGSYKGTFTGQEVAFSGNDRVENFDDLFNPGLTMSALAVIGMINTTDGASSDANTNYPPVFVYGTGGTYFATMEGLTAAAMTELRPTENQGEAQFDILFTGGTLNWYYSEDSGLSTKLANMRYDNALGDFVNNGLTLGDVAVDPFLKADLVSFNPELSGKVTVTVNEANKIMRADFSLYANVQPGYEFWQTGAYGNNNGGTGFDMEFGGKLIWEKDAGRFYVNDGSFRVSGPTPTPEPSSIILMSFGLLLTGAYVRKQRMGK